MLQWMHVTVHPLNMELVGVNNNISRQLTNQEPLYEDLLCELLLRKPSHSILINPPSM